SDSRRPGDLAPGQHGRIRAGGVASYGERAGGDRGGGRAHPAQPVPDQRPRLHAPGVVSSARRLGRGAERAGGSAERRHHHVLGTTGGGAAPGDRFDRRNPMELTWIAIIGSLSMALAAVCIFIFAVKKDYFHTSKTPSIRSSGAIW